jgi:predicted permease
MVVAVATLAVGIGLNTMIFSVVKAILLNPFGYRQSERLVTISETTPKIPDNPTVDPLTARDLWTRSRSFESMSLYADTAAVVIENGRADIVRGLRVSYGFFDTLGINVEIGRSFLPEEDRPDRKSTVAILSYRMWRDRFGADPAILGRILRLSDSDYLVVGVLPPTFPPLLHGTTELLPEVYMPLGYDFSLNCRACRDFHAIARMKERVTVTEARAELSTVMHNIVQEHPTDYDSAADVAVLPIRDYVLGRVRKPLWAVLGAALFVLVIACTNVAGLLLARASAQARETAVRTALGASWRNLVSHWLIESLLITLPGGMLGLFLVLFGSHTLISLLPSQIPRLAEIRTDRTAVLFALGASLVTAVLCAAAPAWRMSRVDLNEVLKMSPSGSEIRGLWNLRDALVVGELALAFALAVGAGLMFKSFERLTEVDPGYDLHNVLTLTTNVWGPRYVDHQQAILNYYSLVLERVRAAPGVQMAAWTSTLPLDYSVPERLYIVGRAIGTESEAPVVDTYSVSKDYFQVMRIPLKRGRLFESEDSAASPRVALLSESCAQKEFPHQDPVGRQIRLQGDLLTTPWTTVVGVVGDIRQSGLDRAPEMAVYVSQEQEAVIRYYRLVVRTNHDPNLLERTVKDVIASVDNSLPVYHIKSLEDYWAGIMAPRTITLELLAVFSMIALMLGSVGVYGVVSYLVGMRAREIGIRMALGADRWDVLKMVLRHGILLSAGGVVLGFGISLIMTRFLAGLLFDVSDLDWPTSLLVTLVLISVAVSSSYFPARRAASVDPLVVLRDQ